MKYTNVTAIMKLKLIYLLKILLGMAPCIISMYLLYFLGKYEYWVPETPRRDIITIIILVIGMGGSFFAMSSLFENGNNNTRN